MRRVTRSCSARHPRVSRRWAGAALVCWVLAIWQCPAAAQERPAAEKVEPLKTSITATGQIAAEPPANISGLAHSVIQATAGAELDDRLRMVPGFSLFRRTSSLVAHPT